MTHRIVVLGGGYAGMAVANRVARRVEGADVVVVNERERFVERVRLHQVAAGQEAAEYPLANRLRNGARLVVGRARGLDLDGHEIDLGHERLRYDTLVYALGSRAAQAPDEALTLATWEAAQDAAKRVADLAAERGVLAVVGGGLTGIEAATEFAESHPGLRVRMVSEADPGAWLSPRGQAHVRRVFDRLGIEVVAGAPVSDVRDGAVVLAGGRTVGAGLVVACTGFTVPGLARDAGLTVDGGGRVRVDATLRSVSHPDVYAVGDAAVVTMPSGQELRMACATGLPMATVAGNAIAARLTGREPGRLRFRFFNQCVSLGRRDGLIQFVAADDSPHRMVLTGRAAARYKEAVVRGALWFTANAGPYRPVRRRPVAA
ncbi:NAD(P)/FAD-dependent oxidoreductase [Prauserella oleivorans]|uniref:NAD(P)/FAD-dependent oxidoreductase n=1 Tax=Prauserella oleivorans TaxID=1478153 RepID=A0ABW5WCB7_9PSEU